MTRYPARVGLELVQEFYDADVSGADPLNGREGLKALLVYAREQGISTIIVETVSRFALDFIVQETGYTLLTKQGFRMIAADSPGGFTADTPPATFIRQVLVVVSQFEKVLLVAKMKSGRDRASAAAGRRVEGRKGYRKTHPELMQAAQRLARKNPITGKARSLRQIAAELAKLGYLTSTGRTFSPVQVKGLLNPALRWKIVKEATRTDKLAA